MLADSSGFGQADQRERRECWLPRNSPSGHPTDHLASIKATLGQ
jgi:hypothetical protein